VFEPVDLYTTTPDWFFSDSQVNTLVWLPVAFGLEVARAVNKQLESFKQAQRSRCSPKRLQCDLPAYVAAVSGFSINHGDVDDFTERILGWWKEMPPKFGPGAMRL
jgi:hypothetical protein